MALAAGKTAGDQFLRPVEIDDADVVPSMYEDIAISALQRGAGDHGVLAGLANPVDFA